jgi:hypothetical protein
MEPRMVTRVEVIENQNNEELNKLKDENEGLKAQLKEKDNEITDL